ncbi:MAG: NAD(P)-dependent oxidoreductase, partial [Planctomycetaceae bacterium]
MNSSSSNRPRVLVTGGSGFIGAWVLRELLARNVAPVVFDAFENRGRWLRVVGPRSQDVPLHLGSLLDWPALDRAFSDGPVTHVIHLAALLTPDCQADPVRGCEVNVLGTTAVFEAARRHGVRGLSWASSMAVFGPEPGEPPDGSPRAVNRPPSFYGAFKKACELIAEQYWMHHHVASVGLRPHVVYGPERDQGISAGPSLAAQAAAHGAPYTIGFRGILGYDFVGDVARAFVRSALECPAGAFGVDLPSEIASVEQVIAAIERAVPGSAGTLTASGPLLPRNDSPQTAQISQLFPDWRATSLAEGI